MTTSSTRWSYAAFLTASGRLYNWNPLGGLTLHSSEPILTGLADLSRGHYSLLGVCPGLLECTLHPQELLAAQGENIYRIDLRTRPLAKSYTAEHFVTTLKQHGDDQHLFMIGLSSSEMAFMDHRYTKKSLGTRILPEPLNEMKFFDISNHYDKNQSIFMASSPFSRQIYMNNIELVGKSYMEIDTVMKRSCNTFKGGMSSTLLSAANTFGVQVYVRSACLPACLSACANASACLPTCLLVKMLLPVCLFVFLIQHYSLPFSFGFLRHTQFMFLM